MIQVQAMQTIPGYHIKTTLGEGGMAKVYLATQKSLDRPVAIKVLAATFIQDPLIQQQFMQESKLIARLNHPNIVQVIDQGISDQGHPYFVMPYVKSISLNSILQRNDISITRKMNIIMQICSALAYAHRNSIIHRDIKPENVLVDYEGQVRLVDFGIAGYFTAKTDSTAEESEDIVMGTEDYMAPEQLKGNRFSSHLSDIYALGVLIHQVIFGLLPRYANQATYNAQAGDNHQIAGALRPIVAAAINPDPSQRPQSVESIRQELLLITQGRHLNTNRWSIDSTRDNIPTNYTLLDVLKENPFGATYLVNDPKRNRLLVIKKQRLDQIGEAQICATKLMHIQHPHLTRIFGSGKNSRVIITAAEYCPGGSLQERLTQAFSLGQWLIMAQQLCNALACAHSYGLVHGNLRPSNLLFAADNHLKISDFGYPAHTYGTNNHWYQPPQESSSFSSDIYAAGAILFQVFSGKIPSKDWWGLKNRWVLRELPAPLRRLILQMVASNPQRRLASAEMAALSFNQMQDTQQTQVLAKSPN
jgi:eukaryotic-like serine/threonine-protein kinase